MLWWANFSISECRHSTFGLLLLQDASSITIEHPAKQAADGTGPAAAGIVFLRHGRGARNFMDAWDSALRRNVSRTEQQAFNAVARVGVKPLKTHPDNWRVFYGMGRTVTFGILPASGFANGHSYFVQRLHDVRRCSLPPPVTAL